MSQVILRKHITRYELLQNNYNQTYDLKLFEDYQLIPTFKNESKDLFNTVFDTFVSMVTGVDNLEDKTTPWRLYKIYELFFS